MDIDFVAWAAIVGSLLPVVISFVKSSTWSRQAKRVVAIVVSTVAAVVLTGAEMGWSWESWNDVWTTLVPAFGVVYVAAQVTYREFWEGTVIEVFARETFDYRQAA